MRTPKINSKETSNQAHTSGEVAHDGADGTVAPTPGSQPATNNSMPMHGADHVDAPSAPRSNPMMGDMGHSSDSSQPSSAHALLMRQATLGKLPQANPTASIHVEDGGSLDVPLSTVRTKIAGVDVTGHAFGGSLPGPVIRVKQGSTITLRVNNSTEGPTTLHAHGVRMDNEFDGVPGLTQDPIAPGDTFSYELKFPDAGVFWYHPHVKDWSIQDLGSLGAFVVEPEDPTAWNPVNSEEVLVLHDVQLKGQQAGVNEHGQATHVLMGRFGDTQLVNGKSDFRLKAKTGEVMRMHLVNGAEARPFNIAIEGAKIKVVGGDIGNNESESWADAVSISPAERYTIEVLFEHAGEHAILNKTPDGVTKLGAVDVQADAVDESFAEEFFALRTYDSVTTSIDRLRPHFNRPVDKRLVMSMDMAMQPGEHEMDGPSPSMPGMDHSSAPSSMPGMEPSPASSSMPGMEHSPTPSSMPMNHSPSETTSGMVDELSPGTMPGMVVDGQPAHPAPGADLGKPLWERTSGIEWNDVMPEMNLNSTAKSVVWKLQDPDTGDTNSDINWSFETGEVAKIEVFNDPDVGHPMQHPLHFHGQRFLVLSTNGVANPILQWKDTVLVRPGERHELLMENDNPGKWVFHCHITRHAMGGEEMRMNGFFSVQSASAKSSG